MAYTKNITVQKLPKSDIPDVFAYHALKTPEIALDSISWTPKYKYLSRERVKYEQH